jgi:aminopeptidase
MTDPRIANLARILVQYSTKVQKGDKVAISGYPLEPVATPLIREVYREVLLAGGYPHTFIDFEERDYLFFALANEEQLRYVSPIRRMVIEEFDVEFRIGSQTNTRRLSGIDPEKQRIFSQAVRDLADTFMQRSASGAYRWVATRFPTQAYAQDAEMSLKEFEDFFYGCTFADTDDPIARWQAMREDQDRLVQWLSGRKEMLVKGPDVDLRFSVEGRVFLNDAGECNMPDGEIETGPVEDSVNGWVRFHYPAIEDGREVHGVELYFEDGRVVKATAEKGEDFLLSMLELDAGARYLGEFAIGTNERIQRFTKDMLFDEKMSGTVHMALGAGYPETGSKNKSSLHWDMLCEMRNGGQIVVDGDLFYESGRFMI